VPVDAAYPDLEELLSAIGEAGRRRSEIEATEGAAGKISVYWGWPLESRRRFPLAQTMDLPQPVPELAGKTFVVSGSGRRLREIIEDPAANLGCAVVNPGGTTAQHYTSPRCLFTRFTSEFNSHLAVYADQVRATGTKFHAVIHAQPPYLTYLSHIRRYQDTDFVNCHQLRWEPEMIVNLPHGLGAVAFQVPGLAELMAATVTALRQQRVIVWCKHGVVARSDQSVKRAADRAEYAETGVPPQPMGDNSETPG